jgi:hypothetical protein
MLALAAAVAAAGPASAQIITGWSFDTAPYVVGTTGDSVTSNLGPVAGTGYQIGFTNSIASPGTTATYTYNTVNSSGTQVNLTATVNTTVHPYNSDATVTAQTASNDIINTAGSITENTWRVRSANTQNTALGFSRAAPQYTQGTQWVTSTIGYNNIGFQWDLFSTNQAIRDLQVQYSTDGSIWTNVGSSIQLSPNTFQGATSPNFALSLPVGAANQPYLGVRLVTAYDSTGNTPDYAGATLSGGLTIPYNNNSGNWRLGDLEFTGAAVPEPGTLLLTAAAAGGLVVRRRTQKK